MKYEISNTAPEIKLTSCFAHKHVPDMEIPKSKVKYIQ